MSQTKKSSFSEALSNITVGAGINWTINLLVLPLLWNEDSPKMSAFYITLVFTAFSLTRQFVIRRWFNNHTESAA